MAGKRGETHVPVARDSDPPRRANFFEFVREARNYCVQVTDAGTLTTTSAVSGNGHALLTIRRQAGGDTGRGHAEHVVDVLETRVRKIVEIHQAVRKTEMP